MKTYLPFAHLMILHSKRKTKQDKVHERMFDKKKYLTAPTFYIMIAKVMEHGAYRGTDAAV